MKQAIPQRVCGALWLKGRPEALCQLEKGHPFEHYFKNELYWVTWVGDSNAKSQKKIVLAEDPE